MGRMKEVQMCLLDIQEGLNAMVESQNEYERQQESIHVMNSVLDISYLYRSVVSGGEAKKRFIETQRYLQESRK